MPKTTFGRDYPFLPRADLLSFEEIVRVARVCVDLGVEKIRLTGGEPLLRRDIERLIEQLARLPVDLALTTNGTLLKEKARALRDAGLRRVTVSLDGIADAAFRRMTDTDYPVGAVLAGIEAAVAVGLAPVKINCVVKRSVNDDQILPMVGHFRGSACIPRFIEYMDVGMTNGWRCDEVVPSREILARIDAVFPLVPIDPDHPGEVAERWGHADGAGEIGVVAAVTQAFCADCSRLRLATDGKLHTCLFAQYGQDLRPLLRGSTGDNRLIGMIAETWWSRADRYSELRHSAGVTPLRKIEMSYIGG